MKTIIEENLTTTIDIDMDNYSPPISITKKENKLCRYTPIKFVRKLITYDITMGQDEKCIGTMNGLIFYIKIDYSTNFIKNRFEILDI